MSKRIKIIPKKKNCIENGTRIFLKFSIPHSNGDIFSFKKGVKSLKKNIIKKKIKNTIEERINEIIIKINILYNTKRWKIYFTKISN